MLEQSGWEKNEIEDAFKKAHLLGNVDLILSAPFFYFKKIIKFIISLPLKTIRAISQKSLSAFEDISRLLTRLTTNLFSSEKKISQYASYLPKRTILYFKNRKKQKAQDRNAIKELAKYIEKGQHEGILESDILVELLTIGWNHKVINKAFSAVRFKIFKKNLLSFLKFLITAPFIVVIKTLKSIYSVLKTIFLNLPILIFNSGKKIATSIKTGIVRIISSLIISIKRFIKIFAKRPTPKFIQKITQPPKITIFQKIKILFLYYANAVKNVLKNIFKKKVPSPEISIKIQKSPTLIHFINSLKYFIKSYPQAFSRLKQRSVFLLAYLAKQLRGKSLKLFYKTKDFIKYGLKFFLKRFFVNLPQSLIKRVLAEITAVNLLSLIGQILRLLVKIIIWPFILIKRMPVSLFNKLRKINLEVFNIPFEAAEFAILKIYKTLKRAALPAISQFAVTVKSLTKVFIPAIKEAETTPQNLSEVPVGEVSDRMKALDVLKIASRMFKTRRMRTFLTILGIGIGIGAILFLVSLGYGLQRILIEEIATSDALLSLDVSTRDEELIPLNKESIEKLANSPDVSYVSPLISISGQITLENVTANAMVNGVLPNYFKLAGISANIGDLFKEEENDKILISLPIVKLLNLGQDGEEISKEQMQQMLGKSISITLLVPIKAAGGEEETKTVEFETNFKISGIIKDSAESLIYFPLSRLEDAGITKYQSAKIRVVNNNSLETVRAKAVETGFIVSALSDTIEQANKVFQVLQIVLSLFGIVALAVSAIGMFNTMTIALLERTQEIGIMKSLGASNRNVWELFLAESIIMGFLGGVGGIVIGYLGSEMVNLTIRLLAGALGGRKVDLFERPWWFIITILVFSTAVGLFTGLWPARRAANIRILQALRYK